MAGAKFTLVNLLSILLTGRQPQWLAQADAAYPNGIPPVAAGIGVNLSNSPKTLVDIQVREVTHARTARITITFDGASTYTVNGNTNAVATVGNTDVATTIADMAADITADTPAGLGDVVTATAVESVVGGGVDTLLLVGKANADWVLTDASVAGGAGTITATLDRTSALFQVYGLPKGPGGPAVYQLLNNSAFTAPLEGWLDRFDTASVERLYVELVSFVVPADAVGASGTLAYRDPDIWIGPAIQE